MSVKIRLKRGTLAEWTTANPVLGLGEPGFVVDTNQLKIGDGVTEWDDLLYINDDLLSINDALLFKGTLGTEGTVTALPSVYETGWTFKVITPDTYAGKVCEFGDLIISIADRLSGDGISDDWVVVQANIDGAVTSLGGTVNRLAKFSAGSIIEDTVISESGGIVNVSGVLNVNSVNVSVSGHSHVSNDITDFNTSVSGLLPAISNSGDNRILTSTGTTTGVNAETNLTFDGTLLSVSGNFVANSGSLDRLIFNTNLGDPDLDTAQLAWNPSEGTVDLGVSDTYAMHLGEELHYRVRNNTGSTLAKGTPVYASGLTPGGNNRIEVAPFTADGLTREVRFMGLVTENINTGVNGYTTHFGYIRGIDTRGDYAANGDSGKLWSVGEPSWSEGDILYPHPTVAGKLTKVEPKHSISVAIILNRHQNNGKIFVRPTSYGHLDDNHDVNVSGVTNGQYLQYNAATDYWVPTSSGIFTSLKINNFDVTNLSVASGLGNNDLLVAIIDPTGTPSTQVLQANVLRSSLLNQPAVLRLRQGTEVERLLITPASGEPIWTTDSQKFYIGDGTTVGGDFVGPSPYEKDTTQNVIPTDGNCLIFGNRSVIGCGNNNVIANRVRRANNISSSTNTITVLNATASHFNNTSINALQIRYRGVSGTFNLITRTVSSATQSGTDVVLVLTTNVGSSGETWTEVNVINTANTSGNNDSVIGGGTSNLIQGGSRGQTIGGGLQNTCSGYCSVVNGGFKNTSIGLRSTVGGGSNNTSSGEYSTVAGGTYNTASGGVSFVAGGTYNTASGGGSFVGGGYSNTASGYKSFVGGGSGNEAKNEAGPDTVAGGQENIASGGWSSIGGGGFNRSEGSLSTVGGGSNNTSSGVYSTVPGGFRGKSTRCGELSHAAGMFANDGDAQHTILIARRTTTNATANQVLFLDGSSARLTLPAETTWAFTIKLSAYNDTDNEGGWWIFRGGIRRNAANNTALIGSLITESGTESSLSSASASVVADDTNEALEIRVTGVASKNIRWVAVVDISQVSYGTP